MTDKQIMINGVYVSGCKLYRDEISFVGGEIYTDVCSIWIWQRDYSGLEPSCVMKCHCKDNPNCLFKQLKRKEQELENICKAFDIEYTIDEETGNLIGRCNKLYKKEQECEELKEELILKDVANIELSDEVKKYRKAIDEIEEIADNNYEIAEMKQIFLIIGGLDV